MGIQEFFLFSMQHKYSLNHSIRTLLENYLNGPSSFITSV